MRTENAGTFPSRRVRTVVLTNTRQSVRFESLAEDEAPDPALEYQYLAEFGVDQALRDRNDFPINPWARSAILFAGIDVVRAFRVLLFDRKVDVVLCVFENTALVILALRKLFRFKPPVLLYEVSGRGWRPRDLMLDFVVPRIDQVLTLTTRSKTYVDGSYRAKRPAIVVGYWIDEVFFRPDAPLTTPPIRPDEYVLAVGDDYSRDYATLLEACKTLPFAVILRTRIHVEVPPEMRDRVTVIPERQSYRALRDLYRRARMVVVPLHPTEHPGGITSLFEGMAMGKPVICSTTGVTSDYVQHGTTGLLVPPGDPAALCQSIRGLLDDPAKAEQLGAAARRHAERHLSKREYCRRLATAIRNAVGLPGPTPDA